MKFLLIGHGSIGSRYKQCLMELGTKKDDLYIIETNSNIIEDLSSKGFKCYRSISEIKGIENNVKVGIVANWGPDHLKTANELIDIGCKRMIIEKPISNSINELQIFKQRVQENNIFVTVHYHWQYTKIFDLIKSTAYELKLGEAIGIRISGGAVGLSTNGTHFLDFACKVLDSEPKTVISDLDIDYINPRDKSLAYIAGSASYRMGNNSFIHVSFSNKNSQSIRAEILYRNGIIEVGTDGNLNCLKREEEAIKLYGDKITRYGELNHIKKINFNDPSTINVILKNLIHEEKECVSLDNAESALRMVLGAIQSHNESRKIELYNIVDSNIRIS